MSGKPTTVTRFVYPKSLHSKIILSPQLLTRSKQPHLFRPFSQKEFNEFLRTTRCLFHGWNLQIPKGILK